MILGASVLQVSFFIVDHIAKKKPRQIAIAVADGPSDDPNTIQLEENLQTKLNLAGLVGRRGNPSKI